MSKIKIDYRSDIKVVLPFNITHTPRAYNLINYLAAKGKKVTLITCIVTKKAGDIKFPDNVYVEHLFDLTKRTLKTFIIKLRFKIGRVLLEKYRIETRSSFGYGTEEFINLASRIIQKNDVVFCFKEVGLLVGKQLIQTGHKNIVFDFEDWFSEDLPEKSRKYRPIRLIKKYEKDVICKQIPILVPSIEMKKGFEKAFGEGNFHTYYNSFEYKLIEANFKITDETIKLIWFSQVISFGRGLEEFLDILAHINYPLHIDLIGKMDTKFAHAIASKFKSYQQAHSYTLHGFLNDKDLDDHVTKAHFGLGLEKSTIISRDLTITYKCFRYLMNGTPSILSKTKGQEEFASITSNVSSVINLNEIKDSAEQLNTLFFHVMNESGYYLNLRTKTHTSAQQFKIFNILDKIFDFNDPST